MGEREREDEEDYQAEVPEITIWLGTAGQPHLLPGEPVAAHVADGHVPLHRLQARRPRAHI
eukprot:6621353-Pyramimonas_sp.AAC.1